MIIRAIAKLLALLNSNRRAVEIGASIAFGLWLALVPASNLLFAAIVLIALLVKINPGMTIVSFLIFSLITPLVDPALNELGIRLLGIPALQGFYRCAWAVPIVPLTRFNDALVTGSVVAGAVLFAPVTVGGIGLVHLYRKHVHARIANSRLVKAFMATPWVQKLTAAVRGVRRVWPVAG